MSERGDSVDLWIRIWGADPMRPREDWEMPGEPGEPDPRSFRGQCLALREKVEQAAEDLRAWAAAIPMAEARGNVWRANRLPRRPHRRKHPVRRRRARRG